MRILTWEENTLAENYMAEAAKIAQSATCERSKCWSIIVKNWKIIWIGYNSPAKNLETQRRCNCDKNSYHRKTTDKTCCIHAEQRALFDALRNYPDEIEWATLYFIRLDKNNQPTKSWKPYCTICSKSALELWIKEFILRHEEGITAYDTEEYNILSYQYDEI
jgi:deoxycytidylate deaminase